MIYIGEHFTCSLSLVHIFLFKNGTQCVSQRTRSAYRVTSFKSCWCIKSKWMRRETEIPQIKYTRSNYFLNVLLREMSPPTFKKTILLSPSVAWNADKLLFFWRPQRSLPNILRRKWRFLDGFRPRPSAETRDREQDYVLVNRDPDQLISPQRKLATHAGQ